MRPDFPHVVDSTMLATFRSCPQKFFRSYVEHWKPKSESVHLVAGGAFAKGLEVARRSFYERGANAEEALEWGMKALLETYGDFECPADSAKSAMRMAGALEFYFQQYPLLDPDGPHPISLPGGSKDLLETPADADGREVFLLQQALNGLDPIQVLDAVLPPVGVGAGGF
jgi:hypothetical protein